MACKTVLRFALSTEARRPTGSGRCFSRPPSLSPSSLGYCLAVKKLGLGGYAVVGCRKYHDSRRIRVSCYDEDCADQGPPQEAVLKAISEVSKTEGRVGQTTNMIIGGTVADDSTKEWLELDQKVNTYPTERGFTAIGTGGDDFVQAIVVAVESVVQQSVPQERVRQTVSSKGKYVSVKIGPIRVISSEQVQAVYSAMRRDNRMKYFL